MKRLSMPLITVMAPLAFAPAMAADTATGTSAKTVRKEVGEAASSIAAYSARKRDEAEREARQALDRFDRRMDKLEQHARRKATDIMAELKEARAEAQARYEALKKSTTARWDEAKAQLAESYAGLEEKLGNAEESTPRRGSK